MTKVYCSVCAEGRGLDVVRCQHCGPNAVGRNFYRRASADSTMVACFRVTDYSERDGTYQIRGDEGRGCTWTGTISVKRLHEYYKALPAEPRWIAADEVTKRLDLLLGGGFACAGCGGPLQRDPSWRADRCPSCGICLSGSVRDEALSMTGGDDESQWLTLTSNTVSTASAELTIPAMLGAMDSLAGLRTIHDCADGDEKSPSQWSWEVHERLKALDRSRAIACQGDYLDDGEGW